MVFPQYLKKYLMCLHQTWYTEAPGQGKDQFRTGDLDQFFKDTKVICVRVFPLNILRNISITEFRTGTQHQVRPGDFDLILKVTKLVLAKIFPRNILRNI